MSLKSILIVEDEELLQEAIIAKLEKDGYRPVGARTVEQALDFLNTFGAVDAIWLNHYLPGQTGLDFTPVLRHNPQWAKIPVFLVTNTVQPEIINEYIKLGVAQYYVKMLTRLETIISRIELELQQLKG